MKETPELHQLGALVSWNLSPEDVSEDKWPKIVHQALLHGLAPMLMWTTKRSFPDVITEPLWTPVISAVRNAAINYVEIEATRKVVTTALEEAQIPALWLKGIALAHTVYPQPVLRPMSDLDVLVPFERREEALPVVERLGYHFLPSQQKVLKPADALRLNLLHHYTLAGGLNDSVILELHFHLLNIDEKLLTREQVAWFWTQTARTHNGSDFAILQPEAHLLYLSAHAVLQHGEANSSLRQYFDLHRLIEQLPMDWEKVIERAAVFGWSYGVERALTLTSLYFSTRIPDRVFAQLQVHRSADASYTRAGRLQEKGARGERVLLGIEGRPLTEKISLMLRWLLPSRPYMRLRYGLSPTQPLWPYYFYRGFDGGRDFAWSVWHRIVKR